MIKKVYTKKSSFNEHTLVFNKQLTSLYLKAYIIKPVMLCILMILAIIGAASILIILFILIQVSKINALL
jgi:hypothetical protein